MIAAVVALMTAGAAAQEPYGVKHAADLDVEIWVNKGDGATYYYGEDVAVYFRASHDAYVVVYDIDPAGDVSLLYPAQYGGNTFVRSDEVYRIPDPNEDYRLEVTGPEGKEFIYVVASLEPIEAPDFVRYAQYEYDNWDYYYDDFIHSVRGRRVDFVADLNYRIAAGMPYVTSAAYFYIDDAYRHHRYYRYTLYDPYYYDPYYYGSCWVGASFVGAEVWIDGIFFGIAPVYLPYLHVGHHVVWIYFNGFPCWQDFVYVRSGHRAFVDAKIPRYYSDYRYGRSHFKDFRFKEKIYRNEPGFKRDVDKMRVKHATVLPKPPIKVEEKYSRAYASGSRKVANEKNVQLGKPDRIDRGALDRKKDLDENNRDVDRSQTMDRKSNRDDDSNSGLIFRKNTDKGDSKGQSQSPRSEPTVEKQKQQKQRIDEPKVKQDEKTAPATRRNDSPDNSRKDSVAPRKATKPEPSTPNRQKEQDRDRDRGRSEPGKENNSLKSRSNDAIFNGEKMKSEIKQRDSGSRQQAAGGRDDDGKSISKGRSLPSSPNSGNSSKSGGKISANRGRK